MTKSLEKKLQQISPDAMEQMIEWLCSINRTSTNFFITKNNTHYFYEPSLRLSNQDIHIVIENGEYTEIPNVVYYVDYPELNDGKPFKQAIHSECAPIWDVIDVAIEKLQNILNKVKREEYINNILFYKNFNNIPMKIHYTGGEVKFFNLSINELNNLKEEVLNLNDIKYATKIITIRENQIYLKFEKFDIDDKPINAFYLIHSDNEVDYPQIFKLTSDIGPFRINREVVIKQLQIAINDIEKLINL